MISKLFKKQNIPNYLTIFRMLLCVIIICFLIFPFGNNLYTIYKADFRLSFVLAGLLFLLASVTDFLDGYIARKYKWVSEWGKLWDPIADKILTNSVLIVFSAYSFIPLWATIIIIGRDVIVDAVRVQLAKKNIDVSANIYGKIKTFALMIAIIIIFFIFAQTPDTNPTSLVYWLQNIPVLIAMCLSIVSGVNYFIAFSKRK